MTDIARSKVDTRPVPPPDEPPADHSDARPDIAVVVRSKIQPPVLRSTTLSRARLIDRLREATQSRLTLLIAEAGYGKTTLLTDFASQSGLRTLWYRLDSSDADAITWTNYLIAAAREVMPEFGKATESLLSQVPTGSPPPNAFVSSLLGELPDLGNERTLVILDDVHLVDHIPDVADIVTELLRLAPPWMSFILSSRRRPTLRLGRLRAMGDVAELRTGDLRFTSAEIAALFADRYRQPLDEDVVATLDERTRGWIASLQLFFGSIRGQQRNRVREMARSLSGATGPTYTFLAEEVLASLPEALGDFLTRASLLDRVSPGLMNALLGIDSDTSPQVDRMIEQADGLGLLARTSDSSAFHHMHPLLRDFLRQELANRADAGEIREMHARVARGLAREDPLTACNHFIDAGLPADAMACLGDSLILTIGSGQWGVASSMVDRLAGTPAHPAVAAIHARRLLDQGELEAAQQLLVDRDVASYPADVRAVVRQTLLTLGWRTGDYGLLLLTLAEIEADVETPVVLRDIARIFVDSSHLSGRPAPLPGLGRRLRLMAQRQAELGHLFYSAISDHNAGVAYLNAGEYRAGLAAAESALATFERLSFDPVERYSTHSIIALCHLELGDDEAAHLHALAGMQSGNEFADVPAELAFASLVVGDRDNAIQLIHRADQLQRESRSDVLGIALTNGAKAYMELGDRPNWAIEVLDEPAVAGPLDLGHNVLRQGVLAQAMMLSGQMDEGAALAARSLKDATTGGAYRAQLRLAMIVALGGQDRTTILQSIEEAAAGSGLAILELVDLLSASLHLIAPLPHAIASSMRKYPRRWLPALRRQLDKGNTPNGHAAARVLDEHGEASDVPRLRAFARTYGRRGLFSVGLELARRTSPMLYVHDLGRVRLAIADRQITLGAMRRKPATLLMYLVSRSAMTAHREQVLDTLWPDADPNSSSNSLNQTLYFLRRQIDPWYEDGVSAEYIAFQSDLLWLDPSLTRADSVEFMLALKDHKGVEATADETLSLLRMYSGHFAPEFEYDEWAIEWRARMRSGLLSLAASSIQAVVLADDLIGARDIAQAALEADPSATDIERTLVWLHWRLGATSAAVAQHGHLSSVEEADGFEPSSLTDLVEAKAPGL